MEEPLFSIQEDRDRNTPKGQIALLLLQVIHEGAGEGCEEIRQYIVDERYVELKGKLTERGERNSPEQRDGNQRWTQWLNDTATDLRNKGVFKPAENYTWRIADLGLAKRERRGLIEELRQIGYADWFIITQEFYEFVTASSAEPVDHNP